MLFQQDSDSGDVDERQKRSVKLVIASEYSTKPLEFLKEALNEMALLVGIPIYRPWIVDITLRWDRINSILGNDIFPDRFRTVCFVAEDIASRNIDLAEQRDRVNRIVIIAGTEQKSQRIAQAIHQSMDLRISAAPGYANRLIS